MSGLACETWKGNGNRQRCTEELCGGEQVELIGMHSRRSLCIAGSEWARETEGMRVVGLGMGRAGEDIDGWIGECSLNRIAENV